MERWKDGKMHIEYMRLKTPADTRFDSHF